MNYFHFRRLNSNHIEIGNAASIHFIFNLLHWKSPKKNLILNLVITKSELNLVKRTIDNLTVTVWSSTSGSEEEKDKTIINLQIGFPERDRLDSLVCIFFSHWPIFPKNDHFMTSYFMTSYKLYDMIFSFIVSVSTKCQKNATKNEHQVSNQPFQTEESRWLVKSERSCAKPDHPVLIFSFSVCIQDWSISTILTVHLKTFWPLGLGL